MLRETLQYLAGNRTLRRTTSVNPLARRLASRFVAGETLTEAVSAVRATAAIGMTASLDYLGENVKSVQEARAGAAAYVSALEEISAADIPANVSCKLTSLGLDLSSDLAEQLLTEVASYASERDNFVRIDMEGSKYTQTTIDVTKRLFSNSPNVGVVVQSCLYRSSDDARDLNRLGIRMRLVKGAYLEPASIAFPQKKEVDANYQRLAEQLLGDGTYPAFATHDETLIEWIKDQASSMGRTKSDFEFQMLYGIRRDLQRGLRAQGFRVRLYIPYGTQWYPYLMRRLAERPANLMFIVGNVAREVGSR